MTELQFANNRICRTKKKTGFDKIQKKDSKLQTKWKMKPMKTSETREGLCFVRSVTDLNIPNT